MLPSLSKLRPVRKQSGIWEGQEDQNWIWWAGLPKISAGALKSHRCHRSHGWSHGRWPFLFPQSWGPGADVCWRKAAAGFLLEKLVRKREKRNYSTHWNDLIHSIGPWVSADSHIAVVRLWDIQIMWGNEPHIHECEFNLHQTSSDVSFIAAFCWGENCEHGTTSFQRRSMSTPIGRTGSIDSDFTYLVSVGWVEGIHHSGADDPPEEIKG